MNTELVTIDQDEIVANVVTAGDLGQLTARQRVDYYAAVCRSMGLNPLTKPFDYIRLNNRLVLYATKAASDQLRKINGVSLGSPAIEIHEDVMMVTVTATDANGRTDTDMGAVSIAGLKGDAKANATMKAITKAKRRVTLSICGLGWLDESEIETIPRTVAQPVMVDAETGEIQPPAGKRATGDDPGPLPDDEQVIAETPAADFINASAALLGLAAQDIKDRLHAMGVKGIPGNGRTSERLALYRRLRDEQPEPLFEVDDTQAAVSPAAQ